MEGPSLLDITSRGYPSLPYSDPSVYAKIRYDDSKPARIKTATPKIVTKPYLCEKEHPAALPGRPKIVPEEHWEDLDRRLKLTEAHVDRAFKSKQFRRPRGDVINHSVESVDSGFTVRDRDGQVVSEFEWAASDVNALYAIRHRHLAPRCHYDPMALQDFKHVATREMDKIIQMFNEQWAQRRALISRDFSLPNWLAGKDSWTKGKKKKYLIRSIQEYLSWDSGKITDVVHPFSSMVKTGEAYHTLMDVSDVVIQDDSRPRNIFVPPDWNCGHIVYI